MSTGAVIAPQKAPTAATAWPIVAPSGMSISNCRSTRRAIPIKAASFSNNMQTGIPELPSPASSVRYRANQGAGRIISGARGVAIALHGTGKDARKSAKTPTRQVVSQC